MKWTYAGSGEWYADSAIKSDFEKACHALIQSKQMRDNGDPYPPLQYRVVVTEHGNFSTSETDSELRSRRAPSEFATLGAARMWCEDREEILIEDQAGLPVKI